MVESGISLLQLCSKKHTVIPYIHISIKQTTATEFRHIGSRYSEVPLMEGGLCSKARLRLYT